MSDGFCHLLDLSATAATSGKQTLVGLNGSELKLADSGEATFEVDAAALLQGKETVEAELVVNGYPVATQTLKANGQPQKLTFKYQFASSSWAAIRVFPHAHTNPIYVVVDGEPVRGPVDSARWCLAGVEQCWKSKQNTYAASEQNDARAAYDHARNVYSKLIGETRK